MNTTPPAREGDLLYGGRAIAAYLGVTIRQVHYLKEKGSLPHWREGHTICARRSTLTGWLAAKEAAGAAKAGGAC